VAERGGRRLGISVRHRHRAVVGDAGRDDVVGVAVGQAEPRKLVTNAA
jgi:hypothetical protein